MGGPVFLTTVPVPESVLSDSQDLADLALSAQASQALWQAQCEQGGPQEGGLLSHCRALVLQVHGPRHRCGRTHTHARAHTCA